MYLFDKSLNSSKVTNKTIVRRHVQQPMAFKWNKVRKGIRGRMVKKGDGGRLQRAQSVKAINHKAAVATADATPWIQPWSCC